MPTFSTSHRFTAVYIPLPIDKKYVLFDIVFFGIQFLSVFIHARHILGLNRAVDGGRG